MKFAYYFPGRWVPLNPELVSGAALRRLAVAAEQAGFHGVALDEHPCPEESWRQRPGGHDAFDPFVALAAVASVTTRLSLLTYLAVVPFRNPFLLAKSATTLDHMSDGRLILGVGTGYQADEFAALGVDYDERNKLFDESLEVMKLAWTGEPVTYDGIGFTAKNVTAQPRPVQQPHPPLWIGGNSKLTMRRVAAGAQGWMPMPNRRVSAGPGYATPLETLDDLRDLIGLLRGYADAIGRVEPIDINHSLADMPRSTDELVDALGQIAEMGVTWVTLNGRGKSVEEAEELALRFGEDVIKQVNG